jgi:hypothetical protein
VHFRVYIFKVPVSYTVLDYLPFSFFILYYGLHYYQRVLIPTIDSICSVIESSGAKRREKVPGGERAKERPCKILSNIFPGLGGKIQDSSSSSQAEFCSKLFKKLIA